MSVVADASVVVDFLLGASATDASEALARHLRGGARLAVPHLLDVEVGQVIRRFLLRGALSAAQARPILADLSGLPLDRYPHGPLIGRAFDWYPNVTIYDGVYLALAEALDRPLLTGDAGLARVPGCEAVVSIVSTAPGAQHP